MTIESNSNSSHLPTPDPVPEHDLEPDDFDGGAGENCLTPEKLATQQAIAMGASLQSQQNVTALKQARSFLKQRITKSVPVKPRVILIVLIAIAYDACCDR